MLNRNRASNEVLRPIPRLVTSIVLIICYTGSNVPTPLYGAFREQFGLSATVQTLVFAAYVVGMIPGLTLTGPLLARFGQRRLLAAGVMVSVLACIVFLAASSVPYLFVARFLQGVSLGIVMVAGSAALHGALPARPRALAALLITVTGAVGCTVGPPLGGFIADLFGGATFETFIVVLVLLLLCLPILGLPRRSGKGDPAGQMISAEEAETELLEGLELGPELPQEPERPRGLFMVSLTAALSWAGVGVFQSIGPTVIGNAIHISSLGMVGLIVAVVLAVAGTTQVLSRRLRITLTRNYGMAALLVGALAFAAMIATGIVALALLAAVMTGIGQGLAYLSSTREAGELVRLRTAGQVGSVMGKYFTVAYLGLALPSIAVGILGDVYDLGTAALWLMAIVAAGCLAMMFSRPGLRAPEPGPQRGELLAASPH